MGNSVDGSRSPDATSFQHIQRAPGLLLVLVAFNSPTMMLPGKNAHLSLSFTGHFV